MSAGSNSVDILQLQADLQKNAQIPLFVYAAEHKAVADDLSFLMDQTQNISRIDLLFFFCINFEVCN
jgi:hypothetical protein